MGSTPAALFFYPVWLFMGLFFLAISLLSLQSKIKGSFGKAGLAVIVAIFLTPIIWYPSVHFYNQYKTDRMYKALDSFIVSIAETGKSPDGFQPKDQVDSLRDDVSKKYEIIFSDDLLGEYEFVVQFANGTRYYFAVNEYGDNWNVHFYKKER
jgi:hypothetical protein